MDTQRCFRCGSNRIMSVSARCKDQCHVTLDDEVFEGCTPGNINIGATGHSSHAEFSVCANCGQMIGQWPLSYRAHIIDDYDYREPDDLMGITPTAHGLIIPPVGLPTLQFNRPVSPQVTTLQPPGTSRLVKRNKGLQTFKPRVPSLLPQTIRPITTPIVPTLLSQNVNPTTSPVVPILLCENINPTTSPIVPTILPQKVNPTTSPVVSTLSPQNVNPTTSPVVPTLFSLSNRYPPDFLDRFPLPTGQPPGAQTLGVIPQVIKPISTTANRTPPIPQLVSQPNTPNAPKLQDLFPDINVPQINIPQVVLTQLTQLPVIPALATNQLIENAVKSTIPQVDINNPLQQHSPEPVLLPHHQHIPNLLQRQPPRGRGNRGGLRFGELERDNTAGLIFCDTEYNNIVRLPEMERNGAMNLTVTDRVAYADTVTPLHSIPITHTMPQNLDFDGDEMNIIQRREVVTNNRYPISSFEEINVGPLENQVVNLEQIIRFTGADTVDTNQPQVEPCSSSSSNEGELPELVRLCRCCGCDNFTITFGRRSPDEAQQQITRCDNCGRVTYN